MSWRSKRPTLVLVFLPLLSTAGLSQPAAVAPRLRLGVLDIAPAAFMMQTTSNPVSTSTSIAVPPPADFTRGLTQMLTTALIGHPEFVVLERAQLDKVLAEQDIGGSGRVEQKTAAAVGRLLGAQALITGDVTEFSYQQSSSGSKLSVLKSLDSRVGAKFDRLTAQVAVDLRIVDAASGEVIGSVRGEGKASTTGVGVEYTSMERELAAGGNKSTPLGAASRQAIERAVAGLVERLRRVPWWGRIAEVRGDRIYINAGSNLGIRPGMQFEVFAQSEAITDPETGAALGTPDERTGQLVITQVTEKYAVGRLTDGKAPQRNDVVRFRGVGPAP